MATAFVSINRVEIMGELRIPLQGNKITKQLADILTMRTAQAPSVKDNRLLRLASDSTHPAILCTCRRGASGYLLKEVANLKGVQVVKTWTNRTRIM